MISSLPLATAPSPAFDVAGSKVLGAAVAPKPALSDLVAPTLKGDRSATRALLTGLSRPVLATARRVLLNTSDAEEAAQEAMIAIVRSLESLQDHRAVVAFAKQIAVRVSLRFREKRRRAQEVHATFENIQSLDSGHENTSPVAETMRRERLERLIDHLEQLSPAQSEVLLMQFVLGFRPAEIASALQIPVNTVRSRVRLGRSALAHRLEQDPDFSQIELDVPPARKDPS